MMFNGIVDNVTFSKALKLMNGHTLKNFAMFISLSASARVSVILLFTPLEMVKSLKSLLNAETRDIYQKLGF